MLCLTCTMISSVDLACYGISRAKIWVSGDGSTEFEPYTATNRRSFSCIVTIGHCAVP